jgi:uncharacterized membrane protein YhaH (DUF805 family)
VVDVASLGIRQASRCDETDAAWLSIGSSAETLFVTYNCSAFATEPYTEVAMKMRWSDLWKWDGEVSGATYAKWGVLLFALKYGLDREVATRLFRRSWSPAEYLFPGHVFQLQSPEDMRFCLWMLALALPFVYVGVTLTVRRLRGSGLPLWLVFLFFVPVLDLLFFIFLSVLTDRGSRPDGLRRVANSQLRRFLPRDSRKAAMLGVIVAALFGVAVMVLAVLVFESYGLGLFVMTPFCVGLVAVLIYGANEPKSHGKCVGVACLAVTLVGTLFLLFGLEGLLCILMAAPLALPLAAFGGSVGYLIQRRDGSGAQMSPITGAMSLALPLLMLVEQLGHPAASLLKVQSAVVVNADAATVWQHVVEFSELPPPTEWVFQVGVAYPIRAEINGRGPGALRKCVFSTGPFIEPIEVWDEPRLLRFGVTENPPPMREWTPYQQIHPPHLHGFLVSERGQFLLTPLTGGRTRLEGTTWYRHNLWPEDYWQWWSDYIIHRIHMRVLRHIKEQAENTRGT